MGIEHEGVEPQPYVLHSIPAAFNLLNEDEKVE